MERLVTISPRGNPPYPVWVGRNAIRHLVEIIPETAARVVWIADDTVARLHGDALQQILQKSRPTLGFTFAAGEMNKTRASKENLEDQLLAAGVGRDTVIVAMGGGVSTDLGGFVASTFLRGVPWVAVPTSLLGAVDASVGGKVGVNTPAGKNLIGAFSQPLAVTIDLDLLTTLPAEQVDNGLGEMVKHAVIADANHLGELMTQSDSLRALDPNATFAPIVRSVEIKADVVNNDPTEQDLRQVLNLGHTIAHAFELLSDYQLSHGRAVAAGLSVEAGIAERLGLLSSKELDTIRAALVALKLPAIVPIQATTQGVLAATRGDKKSRRGRARYALPAGIGIMARGPEGYGHDVEDTIVVAVLEELGCSA
ncbi:MAG: 3-dehydroquinate synthase [Deltaproteobacteria bacterium RIFOXYA12_FULL_58_15]|nr:MAG: 3-dehydroquinate synthase [Deltaproteobacteria bacterium RIFOXYA12_FULL_58_15]OGR12817.1 MAG: 3-dehydroquinate synthase [Deltaproteobacteria bacterium RIFOXYB12_FULL_58_9]